MIRTAPTSLRSLPRQMAFVLLVVAVCAVLCIGLTGCGGGGGAVDNAASAMSAAANKAANAVGANNETGETTGKAFKPTFTSVSFNEGQAKSGGGALIDTTSVKKGYVAAKFSSKKRLKFQAVCGKTTYNYDLPSGEVTYYPLNMGSGKYTFTVLQNTDGNRYATIFSTTANVELKSQTAPFLVPNMFCNYTKESDCVAKAKELSAEAENQAQALEAVYNYVVSNTSYDKEKAKELADQTGYVPNPDETLATGKGICFDYSSLCAAMLRSLGIPCKITTGYVGDNDVYHAWNMVYIDGTWKTINIDVRKKTWTRVDTTLASAGAGSTVGDGTSYTDRYEY